MRALAEPHADLRRYPRVRVARRVIVEVPGSRPRMRNTIDMSPFGMKVRFDAPLRAGTDARLNLSAPGQRPLAIKAIVWRMDPDGPVFVFIGVARDDFIQLKLLVDSYRGA